MKSETEIVSWIKSLPVVLILLFCSHSVSSQVVVERSKDKVVISGIPYYIHQVKKGETAYSISKAYSITVEELTRENPPAVYGVKEGQALRIQVKPVPEDATSESVVINNKRDETKFIYHNLKPGETVYFLSKSYDVSESEIIQSNPGIDINKLPVGAEIAIPRRKFMSSRQQFDDQQKEFIYHKVLQGESLSSIADKYGLKVRDLRKANRDLRFPQVGDYVKVPGAKLAEKHNIEPVLADTVSLIAEEPLRRERPAGFTAVKELRGSLNVAVLLPFYIKENSHRIEIDSSKSTKGKKLPKVTKSEEDWIYPESLDFIEMYEGILLAADTLCSLGMDINLHAFDIKSDTVELTKIIKAGKLTGMDLIIGPVYSHNLSMVAAYAKDFGIPVVSPVPLFNNDVLSNNPVLFLANSSLDVAQQRLAEKISEYQDCNFVFIHSDTTGTDKDVKRFKNLIISELIKKVPYDEIKFKEFTFYSRSMFDNDSINRLSHALSEQFKNIVIIASEKAPVISETIIDVHSLSKKLDVKVFGYPAMRDIVNLDSKYFFDLDIMVYTPNWIDYSRSDVKQFNSDFRQKFLTEPTQKSYAWQGYDIAYYFISGLAIHRNEFVVHPEIHHPDLLQTDYDFVRKTAENGFENQNLFLVRYTKDYEVKLVEENKELSQK